MNQADETFAFMLTILVIMIMFSLIVFFTKINFERERKKNVFTNIAVSLYKKLDDKTKTILCNMSVTIKVSTNEIIVAWLKNNHSNPFAVDENVLLESLKDYILKLEASKKKRNKLY